VTTAELPTARALDAGVPARWVTGDCVYGQYYKHRKALEARGVFYVLAVPMNQRVIAKTTASIRTANGGPTN
jgi:SRSO17 transposase